MHLSVVMRSSDLVLGIVYDLPFFGHLLEKMRVDLLPTYPELKLGTYTHHSHSLHIYARDLERAKSMAGLSGKLALESVEEKVG